jgi:hypothetical protein
MTTRIPAYNSCLHRDVRDCLAAATLIAFVAVLFLVAP